MAELTENKVIVSLKRKRDQLVGKGFGELIEKELILDLKEAVYLVEKEKIEVKQGRKKFSAKNLLGLGESLEEGFYSKYLVFRDLRDRGYVVRTGFKFGFDFRVYPRGKKPGEAHTQWVVSVLSQDAQFTMPELSRMVRLSGNIHSTVLQAVVDSENDINYYELKRVLP